MKVVGVMRSGPGVRTAAVFAACAFFSVQPARGQLTIQFNYLDAGTGFNDPTVGAVRRGALESAAGMLTSYFQGSAALTFDVNSVFQPIGTLAYADSALVSLSPGFQRTVAQDKILSNGASDANGSTADGSIFWNLFHNWDYDDDVGAGAFDFKSTAMHELLHAFGFLSEIDSQGRGANLNPAGTPDAYGVFDRFVTTSSGTPLVDGGTFAFHTSEMGALTGNPGMFFSGPNAMAAYGGNRVPLFSPNPWQGASSGTHLDDGTFSNPPLLMTSATPTGPSPRTLSAVELGILQDLGYAVVPEPGAVVLLLLGLAALHRWK